MTKIGAELSNARKREAKNKLLRDKLLETVNKVLSMKTPTNYQEFIKTTIKLRNYKVKVYKMGEGYIKGVVVVSMSYKGSNMILEIREPRMKVELIEKFVKDRNRLLSEGITKEIADEYFN